MPVKFEIDKADNGNEFLCRKCSYAHIISGTLTQEKVYCRINNYSGPINITFPVTNCSDYNSVDNSKEFENAGYRRFRDEAIYLVWAKSKKDKKAKWHHLNYIQHARYEDEYILPQDEEEESEGN